MKKSSFLQGAFLATTGIIICKVIGLFYVIPFYSIIGSQGGALYSYAYSIYAIFLSLSTSGIPIAISKLVSEYSALGYYYSKEKVYQIGKIVIITVGVFFFVIMMIMAPTLARFILGNLEGGNRIESVTMVIRVISFCLLIVPVLSVTKGYLQGHKMIGSSSKANILEQLVRVTVIILGSLFAVRVFHQSIDTAVGIAVFGATVGALSAYFYLVFKIKKNRELLNRDAKITRNEAKITNRVIFQKIVLYAMPFIVIDLLKSAYALVDTFTVVRTLTNLGYEASISETVIGVLTTWGTKLNMIVIAISLGISISLVPNIASSYVKKDQKGLLHKVQMSILLLLFFVLPMVACISVLSHPIWTIFYGENIMSSSIFSLFIFQAISFSLLTVLLNITQTLNDTKIAIGTLLLGFLLKVLLNTPFMYVCSWFSIGAYYGPSCATILSQTVAIIILLFQLKKRHQLSMGSSKNTMIKIILSVLIMWISLKIIGLFIPIEETSRLLAVVKTFAYVLVGGIIYFIVAMKSGIIKKVFH